MAIGPKDLPKVMRTLGQWAGKARNMVHDVQRSFEQLNYETEVAEKLRKDDLARASTPPPSPPSPPETKSADDHDSAPRNP